MKKNISQSKKIGMIQDGPGPRPVSNNPNKKEKEKGKQEIKIESNKRLKMAGEF